MANQSESSNQENQRGMEPGGNAQTSNPPKGGQGQQGGGQWSPQTGRPDDMRDQPRSPGNTGSQQHTNAGNTGTSGGQHSQHSGTVERAGGSSSDRKG